MHETTFIILKTLVFSKPPQIPQEIFHPVDDRLSTIMYSVQYNIAKVLKASPGVLALLYVTLLNVPLIAKWQTITHNREAFVNDTQFKSNQQHNNYDYLVGQQVLKYDNTIKGRLTINTSGQLRLYTFT